MTTSASSQAHTDRAEQANVEAPATEAHDSAASPADAAPGNTSPEVVPVPAAMSAAAAKQSAKSKATLAEIDKALAANLDVMLQSDAPVDELLQEEPAASSTSAPQAVATQSEGVAQTAHEQSSAMNVESDVATATSSAGESNAPTSAAHVDETTQNAEPTAEEAPSSLNVERTQADESSQSGADSESSAATPAPSPHQVEKPAQVPLAWANANETLHRTLSSLPDGPVHIPIGVGAPPVIDVSPMPPPESELAEQIVQRVGALRRMTLSVLAFINAPIRKIPDGIRPAMDWLAISLALWVPVVWVMAILGNSASDSESHSAEVAAHAAHVSADQREAAPKTIHESSMLKGH